jgi:hypothetical protein
MSTQQERHLEDLKFLHDIANPLAIARLMIKRSLDEALGKRDISPPEVQKDRLEKALEALNEAEKLHASQKLIISSRAENE